jgi:hypothetical protein
MTLAAVRTRTNASPRHAGRTTRRPRSRHTVLKPTSALAPAPCRPRAALAGTIAAHGHVRPQASRTWNSTVDAAHWDVLLNLVRQ